MRTYPTAHAAARAYAGQHRSRVTSWIGYTDRLIQRRVIRPQINRNGQAAAWVIAGAGDWWIVRTSIHTKQPDLLGGPFDKKRDALSTLKAKKSSKLHPGCYEVEAGEGWSLLVVTTAFAEGMGLNL